MNKSKILLVIKLPPPVNGFKIMDKQVAESKLLKANFETKLLNLNFEVELKSKVLRNLFGAYRFIFYLFKLFGLLVIKRFDLVYFTISPVNRFKRDFFIVLLFKLFKRKVVYHLHGKGIDNAAAKNKINRLLYKFTFNNSNVICLSPLLKDDIKLVYKGEPLYVPNGIVNTISEQDILDNNRFNRNPCNILFLSNFIRTKGIYEFLNSLIILKDRNLNFKAFVVGKEYDVKIDAIEALLLENNLVSNVKVIPGLYGKDKKQLLLDSDILVFPTYYESETWGLVLLEAMQAAMPTISTREGAIPEIVEDGFTGFLIEKQNPNAIADKLEILINDSKLRANLGKAGREKFLIKYTIDSFEKNINNAFEKILEK